MVNPENRANILACNHFRYQSGSRSGTVPLQLDGWFNPRRIQAGLNGLSPDEYEEAYYTEHDEHQPDRLQPER